MTDLQSVLDKAVALRAEARRLLEGQRSAAEVDRASKAVAETSQRLDELARTVGVVRRACEVGVSVAADLQRADDGRRNLARHAGDGLPSDQAFIAAQRKIRVSTEAFTAQLGPAWQVWANQQVATLPLERIALLDAALRPQAREWQSTLTSLAAKTPTTTGDIDQFTNALALLSDVLDETPPASEEIISLLQRLAQRPPLTLADLTDDQVALLREAGVADQLDVRRRGA